MLKNELEEEYLQQAKLSDECISRDKTISVLKNEIEITKHHFEIFYFSNQVQNKFKF